MSKLRTAVIGLGIAAVAAGGYYTWRSGKTDAADKTARTTGAENRPISVTTALAQRRDYPVRLSANGIVTALNTVDIRSQITSTVARVYIKEGQFVRAGELLFTLDSRPDEVNLAKAQAQLDKDQASLTDLQRQLARSKDLFDKKFVAQSVLDASQTQVDAQAAVIASDRAAINAARVALSYNRIVAPAAGRTGVISVYPGSLVQANTTATPLVTITQMDPIAISFPLPQRNLQDALESMQQSGNAVAAQLPDRPEQFKGRMQFVDNVVDAASGTVKAKAVFDNKGLKLWPGAYANVDLSVRTLKDAIVIPMEAMVVSPKGSIVYIVDADGKAALRPVTLLNAAGAEAVVQGIEAGAKVIVDGKQNLRPGSVIRERNVDSKSADKKSDSAPGLAGAANKPASQPNPATVAASAASAS
ncbi:efflux RND transporter periplasmic adaptor subunit [Undibacterium sp. Jales W-56]|uniref:efflux RND transporter periplasmic adaptor subunit n=1 Tax=Undibacterium sp. Jales W-56 TaxID=2897325 RepID=UPI0021CE7065|nr:efflux RND transporter periplasmic adaptor subunit [Undibacterium sp. Jales W-56]MCU6432440.1 efflux RND transporter periplasmic adaptor subunit [Undibacterium sp. Jales W-56]